MRSSIRPSARSIRHGSSKGSVSEMLLVVGSLLASIIIVIAAWQLITFQTEVAKTGNLERVSRGVAKNINFVQQISNPYMLRYEVDQNANISIRNGYVRSMAGNITAAFPYIGVADNVDLVVLQGQFLCVSNNAETSGIPSVKPC